MPRIPNTDERTQPTEGAICSCRCRSSSRANSNACARCDISADSTKTATPTTTTATAMATATQTQQQHSNGSRCVDSALYGPRVVAKKKNRRSCLKRSPWPLIGYLTLWQLSTRLDFSTVGRIRLSRRMRMPMRMRIRMWTDTHSPIQQSSIVCESGREKLPGKLGRLHAAKV